MKKILLSALVGLASYTGVYASNEIVYGISISKEVESCIIETANDLLYEVESDINCFNFFLVRKDGVETLVKLESFAQNDVDCFSQGKAHAEIYQNVGYEVGYIISFY
ncbi:hypothetical protein MG290_14530 (plasmid) [Flavobacterium sp. CBA20B-1]|uniref:hypothetical protein n=1 Tax=unclassified Flavobacterium TaxID=196869 RepID=UPI00222444D4|nr:MULTISPECIES: hypothetical protein [unclassified Flavobacterium]WCM43538.1 hypothetical protein MG290_14530 [Flavobacterium sp. CBA20B-1]